MSHLPPSAVAAAPPADDSAARAQFTCTILENVLLCREHYRLVLVLPHFPPTRAGQFIQIACRDLDLDYSPQKEIDWHADRPVGVEGRELMSPVALLRRPFSLAGRRDTSRGVELEIIYRTVGVGTRWLSSLRNGQRLQIAGPLGNHFEHPVENALAVLVGGGVGIPPMIYLANELSRRRAILFCGALTRELLPLSLTADAPQPAADSIEPLYNVLPFAEHGIPAVISTDDGSYGFRGYITDALEQYLDRYFPGAGPGDPGAATRAVVYTCGPELMMKRVAQLAADHGLECQVSVERAMACGMGTCQSCCIRVRKSDPSQPPLAGKEWCYRLACTDGPVFKGSELLW